MFFSISKKHIFLLSFFYFCSLVDHLHLVDRFSILPSVITAIILVFFFTKNQIFYRNMTNVREGLLRNMVNAVKQEALPWFSIESEHMCYIEHCNCTVALFEFCFLLSGTRLFDYMNEKSFQQKKIRQFFHKKTKERVLNKSLWYFELNKSFSILFLKHKTNK